MASPAAVASHRATLPTSCCSMRGRSALGRPSWSTTCRGASAGCCSGPAGSSTSSSTGSPWCRAAFPRRTARAACSGAAHRRSMSTDQDARKQVIDIVGELFALGQLTPTGGNVSARAADADKIWITPSQMYKGALTIDSLLCITEDGTVVAGEGKPSVEYQMHWKSYRVREDATG